MSQAVCKTCLGPCKVPDWGRDSSFYANNPNKFDLTVVHNHVWFEPARLAEVEHVRAVTRAMVLAPTHACVGCGRYAFAERGVSCWWCQRRALKAVA